MTIRHHQPLQVIPGEADPGLTELPDAGFPDALVVYNMDYDYDALDWVKHSASAVSAGGALTDAELRASAVAVSVSGMTFDSGYTKVMAIQPEGGKWAITGGVSADANLPGDVAGAMVAVLPATASAAEPTRTEGCMDQLSVDLAGRLRAVTTAPSLIISIDSDASHNPQYLGLAAKNTTAAQALWQIRKFTIDGNSNVSAIRYANGSEAFNAVWDDRASLSYS